MNKVFKKNKPVITIVGLSIRLHNRVVFPDLHWVIKGGEFWAILGDNGSGKTVLVKALCGEIPFTGGEVLYTPATPGLSEYFDPQSFVGYVSFDQNRDLKAEESLFVQARYWSLDDAVCVDEFLSYENVMEINPFEVRTVGAQKNDYINYRKKICSLFKIQNLMLKNVNHLSNGECRKVIMVRALLKRPSILILDNPFQGLDAAYRDYFNRIIIPFLMKQNILAIVVGTDPYDIPSAVSHILHVKNFNIAFSGPKNGLKLFQKTLPLQNKEKFSNLFSRDSGGKMFKGICIKLSHVNIHSGRKKILRDITWSVNAGEHWAVMGPNGSGKTTLLSLILGDHPQIYANDIEIFGNRWGDGTPVFEVKKRIGWVSPELQICYPSSENCFNTVLSGFFDSIGLFRRVTREQKSVVHDFFKMFDLEGVEDHSFGSLSEGRQRLLLLMRALVKNPQLLILDEPLQGLSPQYSKKILQILDEIARHPLTTLIYVTHCADEIPERIVNRCYLEAGRISKVVYRGLEK